MGYCTARTKHPAYDKVAGGGWCWMPLLLASTGVGCRGFRTIRPQDQTPANMNCCLLRASASPADGVTSKAYCASLRCTSTGRRCWPRSSDCSCPAMTYRRTRTIVRLCPRCSADTAAGLALRLLSMKDAGRRCFGDRRWREHLLPAAQASSASPTPARPPSCARHAQRCAGRRRIAPLRGCRGNGS